MVNFCLKKHEEYWVGDQLKKRMGMQLEEELSLEEAEN